MPVPFPKDESFNSYLSNRPVIVYLAVTVKFRKPRRRKMFLECVVLQEGKVSHMR